MEATAKSVSLLTSCGRKEKIFRGVKHIERPTTFKCTVNGPNEQKHGHIKNDCLLCEITYEENLLHKLKSLIVPALRLFK